MPRTVPANERLRAYGLIGINAVNGLELNLELPVFECVLHVVEDVLLLEHAVRELGVVVSDMTVVIALDGVSGHHGAVEHDAHLDIGILDEVHARGERGSEVDAVLREKATDITYDALHDLLDVGIAFPEAEGEIVITEASVHATAGKQVVHAARGGDEHLVTQGGAEQLVEGLEILEIPDGEQVLLVGMGIDHVLHLAQEGLSRVKPREVIVIGDPSGLLEHAHAHALLFEFAGVYDETDATPHDLRLDGLGEEVGGSRVKGMDLGRGHAVSRDDDDGNVGDGRVRLLFGKDVESGLPRHVQIEQDGVDTVLTALAHDVEGIVTVIRLEYVVLGSEDTAHLHAVDDRVVGDENGLIVHGGSALSRLAFPEVSCRAMRRWPRRRWHRTS